MADPYTDIEYDKAFAGALGSSRSYIITRIIMLVLVFWLLARGIVKYDLSGSLLLLPIAFEFLLMLWVGWLLSKTVIDCRAFKMTAGRTTHVLVLTLIVLGIGTTMLAVQDGNFDIGRVVPGWRWVWQRMLDTGLVWALVVEAVWLVGSTIPEIARWRRTGGKFVWTSTFDTTLRLAALFFIVLGGVFFGILLGDFIGGWLQSPRGLAWGVYGLLIAIEVGALMIGVFVHRQATQKSQLKG